MEACVEDRPGVFCPEALVRAQALRASSREGRGPRQDHGTLSIRGEVGSRVAPEGTITGRRRQESWHGATRRGALRRGTSGRKCVESGCCRLTCKMTQPFSKAIWQHALEIFRAFDPAVPLLEISLRKTSLDILCLSPSGGPRHFWAH